MFYLFFCSLKNVSSASITTPVIVVLLSDAKDSNKKKKTIRSIAINGYKQLDLNEIFV